MAEIIKLPSPQNSLVQLFEELKDLAEKGELTSFYGAGTYKQDNVLVCAMHTPDPPEKYRLIAHLQTDTMMDIVAQNLEWVEE